MSSDITSKHKGAIERVETFIQHLHDMDYVITDRASEIMFGEQSIADGLARAITEYETFKNTSTPLGRHIFASSCSLWIHRAFTWKVIQEGQGLVRKLGECQEKYAQLEKELERVSTAYIDLEKKCKELEDEKRIHTSIKRDSGL